MQNRNSLSGKRVVVIDDDPNVKTAVETALSDAGAIIVLSFDRKVDVAVLDVWIGKGVTSLPIAMALELRGVPFLFYTGYGDSVTTPLRSRWPGCKILQKPLSADELVDAVAAMLTPEMVRRVPRAPRVANL
jgi:DNA-binding NtrC family response regulator